MGGCWTCQGDHFEDHCPWQALTAMADPPRDFWDGGKGKDPSYGPGKGKDGKDKGKDGKGKGDGKKGKEGKGGKGKEAKGKGY